MKIKKLVSFSEKAIGLAFKKKHEPVFFETRWGIHTFFVREPIDVFILDNNYLVRKIKRNLQPWRVFIWNPKYRNVIEVPFNYSEYLNTKIGDKLKFY